MKSWMRQALFQGRHCFCPTPTLGGGGGQSRRQAPTHRLVHTTYFESIPSKNLSLALALTLAH